MFDPETRFLVVDDFKTMRSIVKRTLEAAGFRNHGEAEDGAKGFEALVQGYETQRPYSCVICDWNMPNLTGLELLRKVRADARFKTLPFMLVTAENEQSQVIEAAKAGVSNYVVKPFSPEEFNNKLKLVYNKHSAKKAA